jgi:hypothetical protein
VAWGAQARRSVGGHEILRVDGHESARCIDATLRRFGGCPTYAFPENVPRNIFIVLCPSALCGVVGGGL